MNLEIFLMRQNTEKNDHVPYVGPVRPDGFPRHRHWGRGAKEATDKTERVLYVV